MKKTSIVTAAVLAASFGLVGCGGGGGGSASTSSSTSTVQGTAVDPELVGATVCVDNNGDNLCDGVSVQTDMNGNYSITLDTSDLQAGVTLLVQDGYDRVTKMPFTGTMRTMVDESTATAQQVITPLMTLVYERAAAMGGDIQANMEDAKAEVAALIGVTVDELQANMMQLAENGQAQALQAAMAMQEAAELAAGDANDTRAFYRAMASSMISQGQSVELSTSEEAQSDLAALMTAVADSNLSGVEQLRVKYFAAAMNAMNMAGAESTEMYAMSMEQMQEMIAAMDRDEIQNRMINMFGSISDLVNTVMVNSENIEDYVVKHLLEAAGVAQELVDPVAEVVVVNAEMTVDTGFGMMADIMEQANVKASLLEVVTQTQYDEMIAQLRAMQEQFEPASEA